MRYFSYLTDEKLDKVFYKRPNEFYKDTDKEVLKYALGALLYIPADRYDMIYKSVLTQYEKPRPLVICLEDAVGELGEQEAIESVRLVLNNLANDIFSKNESSPLIFIRIRNEEQLVKIKDILIENRDYITGVIIPKANSYILESFIDILDGFGLDDMYIMPIIETKEFIYEELKEKSFSDLYKMILKNKDRVLGIRIGLTDILGLYGIRRSRKLSIYENIIATSFMKDVINYLNRDDLDIPISGGVSELFNMDDDYIRHKYIEEIELDKYHGFVGKTVIHPKQISIVQALYAVTYEDYMDAKEIIENYNTKIGVKKSLAGDKMNEFKPHYKWANKIMKLSYIYGVLNEGVDYNGFIKNL